MPGRCNNDFGRRVELWNNTAIKQGIIFENICYKCGVFDVEI
jgi:hypothetical protein